MNEEMKTQEVSWDDERFTSDAGGGGRVPLNKFLGKVGHIKRMMVIDRNAVMVPSHYAVHKKKYLRCIADLNAGKCPGCEKLGKPRERFGANVVVYDTTPDGALVSPVKWVLALWTFAVDKFVQLKAAKKEWGDLHQHDFTVACSDDQFQRLTLTVTRDAVWMADKKLMEDIAGYFKEHKFDVVRLIGKAMSIQEMESFIGTPPATTAAPAAGAPPAGGPPASVSTPAPAAVAASAPVVASPAELQSLMADLGI